MNPLASELNSKLSKNAPKILTMLSDLGKELFFPKGILSQGAEAKKKAHKFNATIGIATEGDSPMYVPTLNNFYKNLTPQEIFPYAPPAGRPKLRQLWKEKIYNDNPSLEGKTISNPIITNALTHGLSIVADLFLDENDIIISPDKLWGNYKLTFCTRRKAELKTFPIFNNNNEFNTEALKDLLTEVSKTHKKAVIILNFPNNPTGYTPKQNEADEIVKIINNFAQEDFQIVALCDDAYFGLFFEDSIKESIFAKLTNDNKNLLAIKVDGATKEKFVWGFRIGFISFGYESDNQKEIFESLEKKVQGCIRGTISNVVHSSQSILEKALQDPNFKEECDQKSDILKERSNHLKEVLKQEKYSQHFTQYPFNSGYFMCIKLNKIDAEELRLKLLDDYGVGAVSINKTDLRVAFSCIEKGDLQELFDLILDACISISK